MNGSLCRVWDTGEAAQDNRGSWGHAGQVAMAGQPLLQQPSHLRRLNHHQSMGCHSCPLRTQVRPLTLPDLKGRRSPPLWQIIISHYQPHHAEHKTIPSYLYLPPLFFTQMSATGYLRFPAGWSMPALWPAALLKWLSIQDTLWRGSSTTRTTITEAMTVTSLWWSCEPRSIFQVSLLTRKLKKVTAFSHYRVTSR